MYKSEKSKITFVVISRSYGIKRSIWRKNTQWNKEICLKNIYVNEIKEAYVWKVYMDEIEKRVWREKIANKNKAHICEAHKMKKSMCVWTLKWCVCEILND